MKLMLKDKLLDFHKYWYYYVLQSLLALGTLFLALFALTIEKQPIIVASIGATSFIVFAMPKNVTAKPRNVIGGHIVGLISGYLGSLIPHSSIISSMIVYSLAVGISIFFGNRAERCRNRHFGEGGRIHPGDYSHYLTCSSAP